MPIFNLKERAERRKQKALRDGYDYAAGAILRGEMTPFQLEAQYISFPGEGASEFDFGMRAAVNRLVELNAVTDDRT